MTNGDAITIAFWTGVYAYEGYGIERALSGIHNAGFKNIELVCAPGFAEHVFPETMKEEDYRKLERLLREFDLRVASVNGHIDLVGMSTLPGVKKEVDPHKSLQFWKNRIDLAERLGAPTVTTGMGKPSSQKHYDTLYKYLGKVEDYCSKRGVKVAVETTGGLTGKFVKPIMERLDSKWIGINYDTADTRIWNGINAEDDIENVMNWIMHIHLKDQVGFKNSYDFPALGDGEVHFHEIFRILAKHKWRGTMSAEIEYEGIKGRKAPKRHADVIDNDAQKSCEFIAKMIGRYLGDAKIA